MAGSSSPIRVSAGASKVSSSNLLCYCGDKMKLRTSWTSTNPGRRFLGCPNFECGKKCNMFYWVDDELPNDYYKELLSQMHSQFAIQGKGIQIQHDEDNDQEKDIEMVKIMEEL
ncbi:hypothetical protein OSB04_028742, partial [Centaurea solstitialis]